MDNQIAPCPLCDQPMLIKLSYTRRSGKPFIGLRCTQDGRHFRGFITDKDYVNKVISHAENRQAQIQENIR